jgi:hypothetical protein
MPNLSRTLENAAARFSPVWDIRSSTISRSRHVGTPLFSKWTDRAINARLFGDVHASVVKLKQPS